MQGSRYDLRHFLAGHQTEGDAVAALRLTELDQAMIAAGKRPTTVNRRLDALRRLCRWAQRAGTMTVDIARVSPLFRRHITPNGSYFQSPRDRVLTQPELSFV